MANACINSMQFHVLETIVVCKPDHFSECSECVCSSAGKVRDFLLSVRVHGECAHLYTEREVSFSGYV